MKCLIGRKFNDKEVQKDLDIMPYQIVKKGTGVAVKMGGKEYTPEEVSAMILSKIKTDTEKDEPCCRSRLYPRLRQN